MVKKCLIYPDNSALTLLAQPGCQLLRGKSVSAAVLNSVLCPKRRRVRGNKGTHFPPFVQAPSEEMRLALSTQPLSEQAGHHRPARDLRYKQ